MHVGTHTHTITCIHTHIHGLNVEIKENWQEPVLSFHYVSSWNLTQAISICNKSLLCHFSSLKKQISESQKCVSTIHIFMFSCTHTHEWWKLQMGIPNMLLINTYVHAYIVYIFICVYVCIYCINSYIVYI